MLAALTDRGALMVVAVTVALACSGCTSDGPATSEPVIATTTPSTVATAAECRVQAPGRSGIDVAFDYMGDFVVTPVCTAEVLSTGRTFSTEVRESNAAEVAVDDGSVVKVVAAQAQSSDGAALVDAYLAELAAQGRQFDPVKTLATEARTIIGKPVTSFHMAGVTQGYAYADGSTVVIAHTEAQGQAAEDVVGAILVNVHLRDDLEVDTFPLGQGDFTTPDDVGWIFFRTPASGGYFESCGIGPNGDIAGCDIVPHDAPDGVNETVVTSQAPAQYRFSQNPTFSREVDTLAAGYRVQNGATRCAVGYQGTVNCETALGEHGFVVSGAYGILW